MGRELAQTCTVQQGRSLAGCFVEPAERTTLLNTCKLAFLGGQLALPLGRWKFKPEAKKHFSSESESIQLGVHDFVAA